MRGDAERTGALLACRARHRDALKRKAVDRLRRVGRLRALRLGGGLDQGKVRSRLVDVEQVGFGKALAPVQAVHLPAVCAAQVALGADREELECARAGHRLEERFGDCCAMVRLVSLSVPLRRGDLVGRGERQRALRTGTSRGTPSPGRSPTSWTWSCCSRWRRWRRGRARRAGGRGRALRSSRPCGAGRWSSAAVELVPVEAELPHAVASMPAAAEGD